MKFYKKTKSLIMLAIIFFITPNITLGNENLDFKTKVNQMNNAIIEDYLKNNSYDLNLILDNLNPLLDEAIKNNDADKMEILSNKKISSFKGEVIDSPYHLIVEGKKLSEISNPEDQCYSLLYKISSEDYKDHQIRAFWRMLNSRCDNIEKYSKKSIELINKGIELGQSSRYIVLPPTLEGKISKTASKKIASLADSFKNFSYYSFEWGQWYSLIVSAKKDPKHLNKLITFLNSIDTSSRDNIYELQIKDYKYLALVQKRAFVSTLETFLKDENIFDQGNDIMMRYTGISRISSEILERMLEGFPKLDYHNFDKKEARKALKWLNKNKDYKFKKIKGISDLEYYR